MKRPASALWNRKRPIIFPKSRKKRQQASPSEKQLRWPSWRSRKTERRFPDVLAALTAGRRTVLTEPVSADGKRMHGRAIPVSTPYRLTASVADIPYRMREAGMETASMLWSRVRAVRFAVSGAEKANSSRMPAQTGRCRRRPRTVNRAAAISPATTPAAARRIEGVRPQVRRKIQRRTTVRIRTHCSISWLAAGSIVSPRPRLRPQIQLWTAANGTRRR